MSRILWNMLIESLNWGLVAILIGFYITGIFAQ